MTLFQTALPNIGPGELKKREDGQKSSPKVGTVQTRKINRSTLDSMTTVSFIYSFIQPISAILQKRF